MAVQVKVTLPPIDTPLFDPKSRLLDPAWYRFFESLRERTGGSGDAIATNTTEITLKANKDITIEVGNGLTGGGDLNNNVHIAALEDLGWTAATGTPNKAAYAAYPGQTVSAGYVQAEAQATDNGLKGLAARVLAVEEALRANGAIDG